ncbi:ribose ABC transporter substrate-binding protein [Actinomadura rubrisoli]|uniref:Ribose ABC transporter substrate-binding protein n=2 Tax=Actinomadura rubrisoli TaxID=2530368 RepID=A0A4R5AY98_9ACTN|nr:ribose ABC transporter substrate-binding protein [Actinomadura rubrisoli]
MGFVYASTTQNPFQEMALGAKAAADVDGKVTLNSAAPTGVNGPAQVQLFQSATRNSKDGIALQSLAPDLFVRPLVRAADTDVPTVAVDAAPPPGTKTKLFVGNSNTEVGRALGTEFVKHVPANATGEVVIGNDIPGLGLLEQRIKGLTSVIAKERPGLKIKGPLDSKSEPTDNYNAWNSIVKANPNAIAFLGVGGQDGVSLPLIQKQTGRKFLAGSCDIDPAALKAVKDGSLFALSSPEHWLKGYVALRLMTQHRRAGTKLPEGWWNPGTLVVNSANIDQVMQRQVDAKSRAAYFRAIADKQLANPGTYLKPLSQAD